MERRKPQEIGQEIDHSEHQIEQQLGIGRTYWQSRTSAKTVARRFNCDRVYKGKADRAGSKPAAADCTNSMRVAAECFNLSIYDFCIRCVRCKGGHLGFAIDAADRCRQVHTEQ